MLRPRALTSALRKMNTGGIQSVMLFNPEGVLLAYTSLAGDSERSKAAIAANVWNIYQRQLESSESASSARYLLATEVAASLLTLVR
ncbi:hypothetical protein Smp_128300 [Schistosoma mansoni]|uniref:hypothetical protein n=1 Tax=Schistosoma mansoni TaxID=6183 RepID=UPI00022DBF89|nr:hypothetical protein Smp_128300 [Schistosoma mansoni]|eukprot:XP_018650463.1 hypothetical protein Smp_128300 [Schistosoma mansoni]